MKGNSPLAPSAVVVTSLPYDIRYLSLFIQTTALLHVKSGLEQLNESYRHLLHAKMKGFFNQTPPRGKNFPSVDQTQRIAAQSSVTDPVVGRNDPKAEVIISDSGTNSSSVVDSNSNSSADSISTSRSIFNRIIKLNTRFIRLGLDALSSYGYVSTPEVSESSLSSSTADTDSDLNSSQDSVESQDSQTSESDGKEESPAPFVNPPDSFSVAALHEKWILKDVRAIRIENGAPVSAPVHLGVTEVREFYNDQKKVPVYYPQKIELAFEADQESNEWCNFKLSQAYQHQETTICYHVNFDFLNKNLSLYRPHFRHPRLARILERTSSGWRAQLHYGFPSKNYFRPSRYSDSMPYGTKRSFLLIGPIYPNGTLSL